MGIIETKKIRNVALLGHGGCGKTSLAEAMLYISGGTDRLGKTTDGNTVSDYDTEEIARGFSLCLLLFWQPTIKRTMKAPKINFFIIFYFVVKRSITANKLDICASLAFASSR